MSTLLGRFCSVESVNMKY